jgi:flagellar hook protein FlgE
MVIRDSAQPGTTIGEYQLTFNDTRADGGTLASVTTITGGPFDPATGELSVNVASGPITIAIGRPGTSEGLTQLSNTFAPLAISKDGFPVGNMTSLQVEESGLVRAFFDNGSTRTVYQVPLIDLPNPNGMRALDSQTYVPTPDSGSFFLWDAGAGPTGDIVSFAREESNTDVAGELTNMIKTQRAYSTNAKLIQTVDEMLQETTNMKR